MQVHKCPYCPKSTYLPHPKVKGGKVVLSYISVIDGKLKKLKK